MDILKNKVILVTGGTGSFGNKFTEIVLKKHNPAAASTINRNYECPYIAEKIYADKGQLYNR